MMPMNPLSSSRMASLRLVLFALVLLVTTMSAACAQVSATAEPTTRPAADDDLEQKLEAIAVMMDELVSEGMFQGSVLAADNDRIIFNQSYGTANFQWQQPNAAGTIYRLGSITKIMTAMMILQLAQEGDLELDATVSDYLSYYRRDTGSQITIAQLLDHTSGLPNFTDLPDYPHTISRLKLPTKEFVLTYCQEDLLFPPGSSYFYSNSGYFILGAIIEAVTGKVYGENLEERILEPLNMTRTGYDQNALILEKSATGYLLEGCRNSVAPFVELSVPFSAGANYSTVLDLHKLNLGIDSHAILNEQYTAEMFKGRAVVVPNAIWSTYGWDLSKMPNGDNTGTLTILGKNGQINGFINQMLRTDEYLVVVLSNDQDSYTGAISFAIIQILNGYSPAAVTPRKSTADIVHDTICSQGVEAAIAAYRKLRSEQPAANFTVSDLSTVGQNFLGVGLDIDITLGDIDTAIALFEENAEQYPTDPQVYEDLCMAYTQKADHLPASLCCSTCCQPPSAAEAATQ